MVGQVRFLDERKPLRVVSDQIFGIRFHPGGDEPEAGGPVND